MKSSKCQQMRQWILIVNKSKIKLSELDRAKLGTIIRAITSHNGLKYHKFVTGNSKSSTCRFCSINMEDMVHLALECNGLRIEQKACFGLNPPNITGLLSFINLKHTDQALKNREID